MNTALRTILWGQFGAAIDMLDQTLRACPDELWLDCLWEKATDRPVFSQFWYLAYHALFWLDLYLSGEVEGFAPPVPFTLDELDPAGRVPEKPYTKDQLLAYLAYDRQKCQATIEALTDETAYRQCRFPWGELSFLGLQLYSMRHVQEHAAQLSLRLGQKIGFAPGWVKKARSNPAC